MDHFQYINDWKRLLENHLHPRKIRKVSDDDLPNIHDRAHSAIILSLGDSVLREVGGEKKAVGWWKKLEDTYTNKS